MKMATLYQVLKLRTSGTIPPLSHMPSWHVQAQLYLYLCHICVTVKKIYAYHASGYNEMLSFHNVVTN